MARTLEKEGVRGPSIQRICGALRSRSEDRCSTVFGAVSGEVDGGYRWMPVVAEPNDSSWGVVGNDRSAIPLVEIATWRRCKAEGGGLRGSF